MKDLIRVAIDGPSGAGKSTIARRIADMLDIDYIDTGAMYRAVGFCLLNLGFDLARRELLPRLLDSMDIDFSKGNILLNGEIINDKIRTPEVSKMASDASALPEVREKLVDLQRNMGQSKSVVMDGRDIGTNVLTDAEYKFYLTASVEERARRRWRELHEQGVNVDYEKVKADIEERDRNDSTRALNPLRKAEDAEEIDSSQMSIQDVVETIVNVIRGRQG